MTTMKDRPEYYDRQGKGLTLEELANMMRVRMDPHSSDSEG